MVRLFSLQMFLFKNRLFVLIFLQFILFKVAECQIDIDDSFLKYNDKALNVKDEISQNAELLVNQLIKGKVSDKEKFDIIFKWVSLKINYSHFEFYEPIEYNPQSISRILKKRHTICLGFSQLMDTLCKIAGLKNVTVIGNGKNESFDVGDSLYLHNHSWNAVKLDDLWYLYDVTWSLKQADYKLTKWGQRIETFLEKHPEKLKKKRLRIRGYNNYKNDCDKEYKKQKTYYYKQKWMRTLFRRIVYIIPYKKYKKYYKGASTDFYLSEPNVFAITHIADDPIWNFSDKTNISEFENDSAFYYFNDSLLKHQNRIGFNCKKCDEYYDLSNKEKLIFINTNSRSFNPKNKFIQLICEEALSKIFLQDYYNVTDSIKKKSVLDSSLIYIERSMVTNQLCKNNFSIFIKMQKTKNNKKKSLLLTENKQHVLYVKNNVKETLKSARSVSELLNKSKAFANVYVTKKNQINNFNTDINPNTLFNYSEKRIEKIENIITIKQDSLKALDLMISLKIFSFDSLMANLSLNIWPQAMLYDSIEKPFIKRIRLRYQYKDNYKKPVVDLGKKIAENEYQYFNSTKYILFIPVQECANYFNEIAVLIKYKSAIQSELLNNMREQTKAKIITQESLIDFKEIQVNNWVQHICWLNFNYPKLVTTNYGFEYMSHKQIELVKIIQKENDVERSRYSKINHELKIGSRDGNKRISEVKRRLKVKHKKIIKIYKLK